MQATIIVIMARFVPASDRRQSVQILIWIKQAAAAAVYVCQPGKRRR
jgi:hypothetical protein